MAFLTVTDAAQLLRMEYLEMPGLRLTQRYLQLWSGAA